MTTSKARNCFVALSVALLVGACSSSNSGGAKGTYAASVNSICRSLQKQIGDTLGSDPGKQALAVADAVAKITAVPEPRDDSDIADLFRAALNNTGLALQDVDQSQMVNDTTRATKAMATVKSDAKAAQAAAKSYPLTTCAQGLTLSSS